MDSISLSQEFANSVLPVTIFIGILAAFGIIGNASVIYVYKWKYSACNFRTFVLCLAMIDFTSCIFVFPTEMYGHRIWFSYPKAAAWFCKLKTSMYAVAVFISSYILLLISIDRFRKVCRPLGWQISQKVAFRLCLFIFGISMILIIPCPILFGIQTTNITYAGQNIKITSCQKDDQYKDSVWITIYVAVLYYATVISFMVTTMILYVMILRKLFCGGFLKEIDHTDELKRKSRLQEAEFSGDETRYGVFSSDTFLDASSTCADEHRITNEPKLIRLKSADCLYIQYKDKEGCTKIECLATATDLHNESGETRVCTRNSFKEQTDEIEIDSESNKQTAAKQGYQELDYNETDRHIPETLHVQKDASFTENAVTSNDLWKQNGDMNGMSCEKNATKFIAETESKVPPSQKNNILEADDHLVAGFINKAYVHDDDIKTDEHKVTSYGDNTTTVSKLQSSNAPKGDTCDTEERLSIVLKQCLLNATVSDTCQHINSPQTDAPRTSADSVPSPTLHMQEDNTLIKEDHNTQSTMNKPYTEHLVEKTSTYDGVTDVNANGNKLDMKTLETDKIDVSGNESETVCEDKMDNLQVQESSENINTGFKTEDTGIAEGNDSHEQTNIQTDEKPSQWETIHKKKKPRDHKLKHTSSKQRIRNKSLIMFVVTLIFNITTLVYFCIFTVVIRREHIFEVVTTKTAGIVFFLWRLYFLNHVINPVVYGALDPRFRQVVKKTWRRLRKKRTKLFIRK